MKSETTTKFWKLFHDLPVEIRRHAVDTYRRWQVDPFNRSLQFKRIHRTESIYSVRIGLHYRAVALVEDDVATWFWIGSHSDYDKLIEGL